MQKNLLSLGQVLKEERESKKISLKKIADQTKINISLLEAIEEGRAEFFPVRAYLRGFILAYAKALGLNEKEWLEELQYLSPSEENVHLSEVAGATGPAENLIEKDMRLTPVILAVLILFVLGSILVLSNFLTSHSQQTKWDQETLDTLTDSSNEEGKATEDVPPQKKKKSPPNQPLAELEKKDSDLKSALDSASMEEGKPLSDDKTPLVKQKQPRSSSTDLEIIVQALEEVWVHYQVDGGKKESVLLAESQFKVFKGKKTVFIETKNSDLIYIFHNGKDLGIFGDGGKKEITFSLTENTKGKD